jgi:pyruvate dehydrogenase E1 component alpha subunit
MRHLILLPDLGQTTSEATVVQWLKQIGEKVARGEPLLVVQTDKVDMEVESFVDGYLREVLVAEGTLGTALKPVAILTDAPQETYERLTDAPPLVPISIPDPDQPAVTEETPVRAAAAATTEPAKAKPNRSREVPADLTDERRIGLLRHMIRCRSFEDRVYFLFLQGRMPGTIHQAQGQEACAVGVCSALIEGDMITSTHRPHEHAVARGLSLNSLMAELFAKSTGCCGGKGGSMHFGDIDAGMLPAIAIVGGGIPLAAGYALAMQYQNTGRIVACFFGEGATNIGSFHEGVNLAAIWDLPVVFICENNRYGASTAIEKVTRVPRISKRAAAYGIPGRTIDGNDVEAVYHAMREAGERAVNGKGPTLLELETYRFCGHSRSDPGHYRSKDEVAEWKLRDPLVRYEAVCIDRGILSADEIAEMKASVEAEMDAAVAFAEASPSPLPEECLTHVFA